MMKGRLIVVEGSDASGKATQSRLLLKRLRKEGFKAELFSFPRYKTFFGKLVKRYLQGHFGAMKTLPAEVPAMLYALDRYDAMPLLEKKLRQGKIVVCDRYTASNVAHQGAKLSGKKQKEFIEWVKLLEARLPQPALTIYLDVPLGVSRKLMRGRGRRRDIHERNGSYLKKVRAIYLKLARQRKWAKVSCFKGDRLLPAGEIHSLVWQRAGIALNRALP